LPREHADNISRVLACVIGQEEVVQDEVGEEVILEFVKLLLLEKGSRWNNMTRSKLLLEWATLFNFRWHMLFIFIEEVHHTFIEVNSILWTHVHEDGGSVGGFADRK
jgi:hypothetical protein